jgi:hypothetical protein
MNKYQTLNNLAYKMETMEFIQGNEESIMLRNWS